MFFGKGIKKQTFAAKNCDKSLVISVYSVRHGSLRLKAFEIVLTTPYRDHSVNSPPTTPFYHVEMITHLFTIVNRLYTNFTLCYL